MGGAVADMDNLSCFQLSLQLFVDDVLKAPGALPEEYQYLVKPLKERSPARERWNRNEERFPILAVPLTMVPSERLLTVFSTIYIIYGRPQKFTPWRKGREIVLREL